MEQIQFGYKQTHCDLQYRKDAERERWLEELVKIPKSTWTDYEPKGWLTFILLKKLFVFFFSARCIKTGMRSFSAMREYFRWMNIYVIPETYRAMGFVVGECLNVEKMSLYTNSYGQKHITLEEFDTIQTQCCNNVRFIYFFGGLGIKKHFSDDKTLTNALVGDHRL